MVSIGIGVNEYGVVSNIHDRILVTSGLAGCVIIAAWSDSWGLLVHLSDPRNEIENLQQENGLRMAFYADGIVGEPKRAVVATKLFKGTEPTPNAIRVQKMAQAAFQWSVTYTIRHDTGLAIAYKNGKWICVSKKKYPNENIFKKPDRCSTSQTTGVFMGTLWCKSVHAAAVEI